ncbi:MAG: MlaE family lipid ABC transporter permease subunit [Hyphomicrobiaceae bacterium]
MATELLQAGRPNEGRLPLVATGAWTAEQAHVLDARISQVLEGVAGGTLLTLDMSGVQEIDTFGACLLQRLQRRCRGRNVGLTVHGLPQRFAALVDEIAAAKVTGGVARRPRTLKAVIDHVTRSAMSVGGDFRSFINLLGAVGFALIGILRRPRSFRITSTVHQLDRVAWRAVPIILLITFLIGGIIAQQGFFHFRKFGADQYVVDMVGILVLREIGVLLVAIMVAGRSGSSYTAELGSMKMREEIDALQTMGLDPVAVLVLPRIIALVVALPILTFLGSMAALSGGGLVAWFYGEMHPNIFIARLKDAISLTHFQVGIIKAPFMALVIGIVACMEGLKVRGSAESLGLQTTASVVKSIFLVIVLDGLFAMYFASIGM